MADENFSNLKKYAILIVVLQLIIIFFLSLITGFLVTYTREGIL